MKNKQIIFTEKDKAELLEVPVRMPGAGEVLVRTAASIISAGTERANLSGEVSVGPTTDPNEKPQFPRCLGYSSAGEVVAVGEGVTAFAPGDRVAMYWTVHARYNCLSQSNLVRIPNDVGYPAAALCHIAAFPLAAIRKCRLELGESAIVMGQGILGMLAVVLLRAAGAYPVIAVDPIPEKREEALKLGADYALDPFTLDFATEAKRLTRGGARVGIEVTGVGTGLNGILDCMAPFGRVALLGCTRHSDFTVDFYRKVHGPGISLIGAHTCARPNESAATLWTTADDIRALLDLLAGGRLDFASLIAETHSPEEAPQVYGRLLTERCFPIVAFDWEQLEA